MRGSAALRTGVAPGGALAGPWVQNPLWTAARAVPSLDLRFADNKSLVDATTGSNLVTFTRASSGTFVGSDGVLQTAATDVPRFDHNPTTGESLGLLVEELRANLVLRSEEFGTTWTAPGLSAVTPNTTVAPNGVTTADTLVETTGVSEVHRVSQTISVVSGTTYTLSVFAKQGSRQYVYLGFGPNATWNGTGVNGFFDLQNGTIGTSVNCTATIVAYPNGWYRCTVTSTPTVTNAGAIANIGASSNGIAQTYTGDGSNAVILWGAQLEQGAFATSYIPTTTAAATRSADVASITGSNFSSWYRQDAQTWYGEYTAIYTASATIPANTPHLMQVYTAASANNNYAIRGAEPNITQLAVARNPTSGVQFPAVTLGFALAGQSRRLAYAINSTELQLAGMGVLGGLVTNNSAALMATHDILSIGSGTGGAAPQQVNSHIRRLTYWPIRLSNEVLQRITQ
jgi:hypothetical protein